MEDNGNGDKYIIICKMCGRTFTAKGANAAYCPECRRIRKKELDKKAWDRRKYRAGPTKNERRLKEIIRIEGCIAKELKISPLYLPIWKDWYPTLYKKIIRDRMPDELKPTDHSKDNQAKDDNDNDNDKGGKAG